MIEQRHQAADDANVMLLPGRGGSVAMLGCLLSHVIDRMTHPISIEVALYISGSVSRGTAITVARVRPMTVL
jgi:hypothetical protein